MKNLTEGKPIKAIILMSLPVMMGNFFQQLYNTVDTIIVGRFLGSSSLAAVGSTSTLYYLVMWTATGIASGFAVDSAKHFGAGDMKGLKKCIAASMRLAIFITAILSVLGVTLIKPALVFMNTPEEILEEAYRYIVIILAGLIATMLYSMLSAIFRAMGDSRTPFFFLLFTSIVNIVLDLLFIREFNMGTRGAAVATVIAQALAAVMCVIYMWIKYPVIRLGKSDFKIDLSLDVQLLKLGIPIGAMGALTASGVIILQYAINSYGADTIAAYTAATKLEQFAGMPLTAYSITMINFSGQNVGAQKYDNLFNGVKQCSLLLIATSAVSGVLLYSFARPLASLFVSVGDNSNVIDMASRYLHVVSFFLVIYGMMLMFRSTMQGMGETVAPLINAIVETLSRMVWTYFLVNRPDFSLLCFVNPITWGAASCIIIALYCRKARKIKQLSMSSSMI